MVWAERVGEALVVAPDRNRLRRVWVRSVKPAAVRATRFGAFAPEEVKKE